MPFICQEIQNEPPSKINFSSNKYKVGKNIKQDTQKDPKSIELAEKTAHRLRTLFGLSNRFHLTQCVMIQNFSIPFDTLILQFNFAGQFINMIDGQLDSAFQGTFLAPMALILVDI